MDLERRVFAIGIDRRSVGGERVLEDEFLDPAGAGAAYDFESTPIPDGAFVGRGRLLLALELRGDSLVDDGASGRAETAAESSLRRVFSLARTEFAVSLLVRSPPAIR